jgi:hypothetical protein
MSAPLFLLSSFAALAYSFSTHKKDVVHTAALPRGLAYSFSTHKKDVVHTAALPRGYPFRAAGSCDASIPGSWTGFFPQPLNDLYSLNWTSGGAAGAFTALCSSGSCGWASGAGQLAADNATLTIKFDNQVNLRGSVSANCSTFSFDNNSTWKALGPPPTPITDVHIVAMNHLDVGYNGIPELGLINNILNRYFQVYFPRAISVAASLRARGGAERLVYTTHAFLVHLYVHCPANLTLSGIVLACPSDGDVAAFRAAVAAGDIVWHAAAFNTEYENAFNAEMIDVQFQLARDLADELGVARPRTASLRDVPGTTRALLPHLVRNNITALSVGVNGGSPAPAMPNPGVWADAASGASVLFMQTGQVRVRDAAVGWGGASEAGASEASPRSERSERIGGGDGKSMAYVWA